MQDGRAKPLRACILRPRVQPQGLCILDITRGLGSVQPSKMLPACRCFLLAFLLVCAYSLFLSMEHVHTDPPCAGHLGAWSVTMQYMGLGAMQHAKMLPAVPAQVIWAHVFGTALFQEPLSVLGVVGALLIAAGVLTTNSDKKTKAGGGHGPGAPEAKAPAAPAAMGAAAGPGGAGRQEGQEDEEEEEPEEGRMFIDQHGRLKAKSSFKALLPVKLGGWRRGGAEEEGGEEEGSGALSPGGQASAAAEQGLLPARRGMRSELVHLGRHGQSRGAEGGEHGAEARTPLQALPAERQA